MAGILDKKTRFIDFVVTQEGKRQMTSGKFRAEYASFTDKDAFYSKGDHEDFSERILFEVMERPDNRIVLEVDDSGNLIDFDFSPNSSIVGNDIFDKDATETDNLKLQPVTGSKFASTSTLLFSTFLKHFKSNKMLGSYFDNGSNAFELDKNQINFAISNSVPFPQGPKEEVININNAEPFFFDSKLSHFDNFNFLPPVNTDGTPIAEYTDLRNLKRETLEGIKKDLGVSSFDDDSFSLEDNPKFRQDKMGDFEVINRKNLTPIDNVDDKKQFQTINFSKTSSDNNLIIQMFEFARGSKLKKLDIVDAGVFIDDEAPVGKKEKRIFYVGKVYIDDFNVPTFINIFTLVLD